MMLLGACVAAGVRRVVLRSSTLVYGARADNPAFLHEERPLARIRQSGLVHNYREIDTFAADFARQHPDMHIILLRCAGLVGGGIWSPLAHYLAQQSPRMLLGFTPRIQVLHPDDAAAAFALAALSNFNGAVNLAADDPLPLAQAIRLSGKQPSPLPGALLRGSDWPFGHDFLRHSCVADTRRARRALGWQPSCSAQRALCERAADDEHTSPASGTGSLPGLKQEAG
jgi:UDP-glucose 4-epimerase